MDYVSPYIIDTSTPESLERDFYAWLNSGDGARCYDTTPLPCLSLPPLHDMRCHDPMTPPEMYHFMDGSVGNSPSSGSCSSLDPEPTVPQSIRDVVRSSGRNQLGRTYSPGLPLSMFEREEIVKLFQNGWKICDISKRLCVTHSCVSKILNRFRQTGSVRPKDAKEGRAESPLVIAVRDYRMRLGMTRQSEIREQLIRDGICSRENAPSRSSINHWWLLYSKKKTKMNNESEMYTDKTQASMKTSPLSKSSSLETDIYSALSTAQEYTTSEGSKLSAEPVTDKMFESLKGSKVMASRCSQVREKPTELRFSPLVGHKDEAKCLLVLCNISERDLHFHLKSSTGNIISVPTGNGIIAPHAQVRLVLTWTKTTNYKDWKEVPIPRLILTTKYLDVKKDQAGLTHTRLVAKLGKKTCTLENPPVEQLLLDAIKGHQMEKLAQEPAASPKPEANQGQLLADFVNNLSYRGIFVLVLLLIVCVIIVAGERR